jgi:hypothetical protein
MAGLNLFTNNAATTLASGLTNVATSLTVAAGTGAEFPTLAGSQYFYCTIANNAGSVEIIKVTARSTDTFTIVRGQDGTSGTAWSAGDKVELRLTRIDLLNFPQLDSTNTFATTQTFTAAPVFTDQTGTRTAMLAAKSAANSDITSLTGLTTPLSVAQGGTGQSSYTNGQLLIGNTTGNTLTKATLTAGTGISVTNSTGSITIANTLSGGFQNMQVFTGPGTFTTPATTTQIKITVVGGGGSGGFSPGPTSTSGAGGGGGYGVYVGPVTASTPYAVTVGTGGAAQPTAPSNGVSGNTSSFGSVVSCTGGGGGSVSASGSLGGAGGTATSATFSVAGQAGSPGHTAVGSTATGGSTLLGTAAVGGGSPGAPTVVVATGYGAGGTSNAPFPSLRGAGVNGVVIVEY